MAVAGQANINGQRLVEKTADRGNHPFAHVWQLECTKCGAHYEANSCDFHNRRCPNCQDGAPSSGVGNV